MLKLILFVLLCALGIWLVRRISSARRDGAGGPDGDAREGGRAVEAEFEVLDDETDTR